MAVSALVNLLVSRRLRRVARRTGSPAIEGEAAHLASDVWTSGGAAAGLVLVALTGWDARSTPWSASRSSLYVIVVGARLIWRAVQVLLDGSLPPDELAAIEAVLAGFTETTASASTPCAAAARAASGTLTCTWSCRPTRPSATAT